MVDYLYPFGKLESGKAKLAFKLFYKNRKNEEQLIAAAKHYTLACELLKKYSENSYATVATFDSITKNVAKLDENHEITFVEQVKKTLEENTLGEYENSTISSLIQEAKLYEG